MHFIVNDENDAHNWDLDIKFVLDLEGSRESIQKRKEDMRKRITRLSPVDIYQRYPLGVLKTYSLVTKGCVSKWTRQAAMKRRFGSAKFLSMLSFMHIRRWVLLREKGGSMMKNVLLFPIPRY